ncbi:MAG: hypothetical protein H4O13_15660 [Xanthomonadales bacterium]|nr:hypothetical protein [Xanthomonadales bacterium]
MLRLLSAAIAGFLVLVLTTYLVKRADEPFFIILFGSLSAFVLAPWLVLRFWPRPDLVQRAARASTLEAHEFNVVRAWQIAELEDEGLHFVLELASGGTLFLSGQFLYAPVAKRVFPCAELKVSMDTRTKDVLALECAGEPIAIVDTFDAFTDEELERRVYPGAFRLYSKPAGAVLHALGRAVVAR